MAPRTKRSLADRTPRAIRELRAAAERLRRHGTRGDTILAHINPREAWLLDWLPDRRIDRPRNRVTGLPTFSDEDDGSSDMGPGGSSGPGGQGVSPGGLGGTNGMGPDTANDGGAPSTAFDINDPSMGWDAPEDEISFSATQPDWNTYDFVNYAPRGTVRRALQEMWSPSIPSPRLGPPTGTNPGFLSGMVGLIAGGPIGMAMRAGAALGRAQTPEEQAASAREMAAIGARNSGGGEWDDPHRRLGEWVLGDVQAARPASPAPRTLAELSDPASLGRLSDPASLGRLAGTDPAALVASLAAGGGVAALNAADPSGGRDLLRSLLKPGPGGALAGLLGLPR